MIVIRKDESDTTIKLFIDEVEIQQVHIMNFSIDGVSPYYFVKISEFENAVILAKHRLEEFPNQLTLRFYNWLELTDFYIAIDIDTVAHSISEHQEFVKGKNCVLGIKIVPHLENWNFAYSFNDYKIEFDKQWNGSLKQEISKIDWIHKSKNPLLSIYSLDFQQSLEKTFSTNFSDEKISEIVKPFIKIILDCHNNTLDNLKLLTYNNSLSVLFDFPEELKVPCEQYLTYFVQFLRDLGINSTPNLKEEAGKVLFSVTPTDDVQALDKIREALAIYLSLPSNPIPNSTGDRTVDMVLSGARANAKHLESQLELAIAKLQFKEATLELKDATIEQHQLMIRKKDVTINELQEIVARKNIFEESLERVEINGEVVEESLYRFSREDDIEIEVTPVLDEKVEEAKIGLVKFHEVNKLKDYGVTFDLPTAIRGLIDYFKRNRD